MTGWLLRLLRNAGGASAHGEYDGVRVDAKTKPMHPGWARTSGVSEELPTFRRLTGQMLRDPVDGDDAAVWRAPVARIALLA